MKVELTVRLIRETEKAVLVDDGDREVWLPKSHTFLPDDYDIGETCIIQVREWLAIEKELI